ncbi:MAG: histidinol dehydrogenase [Gemmatimonadetes bacterium]|nr:histidinol dehydrogenase [Gemmatimonadota bacterium]
MIRRYDATTAPLGLAGLSAYLPSFATTDRSTQEAVAAIVADVATRGDAAVLEYTQRFDGSSLGPADWELPLTACHEALERIPARCGPPWSGPPSRSAATTCGNGTLALPRNAPTAPCSGCG